MATIAPTAETDLLRRALDGDLAATAQLVDDHLHPVWRSAVVAAPDLTAAQTAAARGFVDGLVAAGRSRDATVSLRTRLVAAARRAAADSAPAGGSAIAAGADPVLAAFVVLPEQSRTALWLTEVEGGTVEQVVPVLGLRRSETAAVVDRAVAAFRQRLAADAADRAEAAGSPACAAALRSLPDHAAGALDDDARADLAEHLGTCGSCAGTMALAVAPRTALRRAIPVLPSSLALAVVEECQRRLRRGAAPVLAGAEKVLGAAAAAVIAVGLGGIALLGQNRVPKVAVALADAPGADEAAAGGPAGLPTGESAAGAGDTSGGGVPEPPSSTAATSGGDDAVERDGDDGSTDRTTLPVTDPQDVAPPAPPPPPPGSSDVAPPPPPPPPPPAADESATQVVVSVLGNEGVVLELGDCTGLSLLGVTAGCTTGPEGPLQITIDLPVPGLPTISLGL